MRNICQFTIPASRDIENIVIDFHKLSRRAGALRQAQYKSRLPLNRRDACSTKFWDIFEVGSRDKLLPSLRSFPVENYLIFYRPIAAGIEILRVVSGYRDLDMLFDKLDNE
jgi:toxin ParE1/3/4